MNDVDAVKAGHAAFIRAIVPVDYLALYPAVVKAQNGQTLDVKPDDPRVPEMQGIPIRLLPGCEADITPGSRVLLGFEDARPSKPYAAPWGAGSITALRIGGSTKVARDGEDVAFDIVPLTGGQLLWGTFFQAIATALGGGVATAYNAAKTTPIGTVDGGSSILRTS